MKPLPDYLKGLLVSLLPAVSLCSIVLFSIKDIFSVGTKPQQLLMYYDIIYGAAWVSSALCFLSWVIGNLALLYARKKDTWLGYNLGGVLQLIYFIELFRFLGNFWN